MLDFADFAFLEAAYFKPYRRAEQVVASVLGMRNFSVPHLSERDENVFAIVEYGPLETPLLKPCLDTVHLFRLEDDENVFHTSFVPVSRDGFIRRVCVISVDLDPQDSTIIVHMELFLGGASVWREQVVQRILLSEPELVSSEK